MSRPTVAALLASMALCGTAAAAPDERPMTAVPLAAGETIRLTGRLDHPAWQRAPVFDRFVEKDPVTGGVPPQRTRVRLLFDARALWVGVEADDSRPDEIRDDLARTDLVNRTQDFVVVYIDGIGARRSAQFFRVNAAGSTADGIHTAADDSEDFAPDFDWDGAAARHRGGWTAVLRLPFASLRYAGGGAPWRIMVARRIPRVDYHLAASVTIPREAPSFIATMQPLAGLQLPEHDSFLTLRPSLTVARLRDRPAGSPSSSDDTVDASLDLKWRPRPELVVDATVNPDFSQVALDVPQVSGNTRFALELAEKRPFFFESADLLRAPTAAFYTRSFTAPRWGLRATWRGSRLAGSAFAIDDRGGGLVLLPGPYGTGIAEQPPSRTLAARVRTGDGRLHWGGVMALRRYDAGRGDNQVAGPDLEWAIDDAWALRAQWLHARTSAHADDGGGLRRGPDRAGNRVYLRAARNVEHAETVLLLDDVGDGFRHDSGFVAQSGIRKAEIFHRGIWRPLGPFHELSLGVTARRVEERTNGATVEQTVYPSLWVLGARNLDAWFEWHGFERARPGAGGPLLRPHYGLFGLVMSPATWFPLMEFHLDAGRLADTVAGRVRPGVRWTFIGTFRPLRQLEIEPTVSHAWLREDGVRRYAERVAQLLAIWHLGPRSHLRAIVQRTRIERRAEAGVPPSADAQDATSLTWTWRHSPGTVLYVGASRLRDGAAARARGSEVFVKLQFDADDWRR